MTEVFRTRKWNFRYEAFLHRSDKGLRVCQKSSFAKPSSTDGEAPLFAVIGFRLRKEASILVVVIYYPYRVIPSAKNSRVRAGPKTVNLYEKGGLTRTENIC